MTQSAPPIELVAPADNLAAPKAVVEAGADTVYLDSKNATNARSFAGLSFTKSDIRAGAEFTHRKERQVLFVIDTFPQPGRTTEWRMAVDATYMLGANAVILADLGLTAYVCERYPNLQLHLSVQGSATHADTIGLVREQFGIHRAVLPRMLALTEVERVIQQASVQIEVFGFSGLCVIAEGRCLLPSYATEDSPNNKGVCSSAHAVRWIERGGSLDARLGSIVIDQYAPGEPAGYPTLCKGRFLVDGEVGHVLEEPTGPSTLSLLPRLLATGVSTIKIGGRQHSPAYVTQVVTILRAALNAAQAGPARFSIKPD